MCSRLCVAREDCGLSKEDVAGALGLSQSALEPPTKPMKTEALSAGYYHSPGWNRDYQKIQIRTIEQLLAGESFDMPPTNITLAQAQRVKTGTEQGKMF